MLAVPIEEPSMTISAPNVKPEFVSLQEAAVLYSVSAVSYTHLASRRHNSLIRRSAGPMLSIGLMAPPSTW